MSIKIRTFAY